MSFYLSMFDGLRAFYCRYSNERASAGFSAAAALSFLFGVNFASSFVVTQYYGAGAVVFPFHYKILAVLLGVGCLLAHVAWAKTTGRYNSKEPPSDKRWSQKLVAYLVVTVALAMGAIACAIASRPKL